MQWLQVKELNSLTLHWLCYIFDSSSISTPYSHSSSEPLWLCSSSHRAPHCSSLLLTAPHCSSLQEQNIHWDPQPETGHHLTGSVKPQDHSDKYSLKDTRDMYEWVSRSRLRWDDQGQEKIRLNNPDMWQLRIIKSLTIRSWDLKNRPLNIFCFLIFKKMPCDFTNDVTVPWFLVFPSFLVIDLFSFFWLWVYKIVCPSFPVVPRFPVGFGSPSKTRSPGACSQDNIFL